MGRMWRSASWSRSCFEPPVSLRKDESTQSAPANDEMRTVSRSRLAASLSESIREVNMKKCVRLSETRIGASNIRVSKAAPDDSCSCARTSTTHSGAPGFTWTFNSYMPAPKHGLFLRIFAKTCPSASSPVNDSSHLGVFGFSGNSTVRLGLQPVSGVTTTYKACVLSLMSLARKANARTSRPAVPTKVPLVGTPASRGTIEGLGGLGACTVVVGLAVELDSACGGAVELAVKEVVGSVDALVGGGVGAGVSGGVGGSCTPSATTKTSPYKACLASTATKAAQTRCASKKGWQSLANSSSFIRALQTPAKDLPVKSAWSRKSASSVPGL
mmetsp:Transcript_105277/g.191479  ORF Transcript_105277/g.191479 Transcript_105277/m.191479 type:complete len:329 (-) Transcript_105277:116-1102(-)